MAKIDNEIKQRGQNFSLQPRPDVWKRVEAELDKHNRGRIIGWWWLTPVIIITWGLAFSFLSQKDQTAFYSKDATHHPLSEKNNAASKKDIPANASQPPTDPIIIKPGKAATSPNLSSGKINQQVGGTATKTEAGTKKHSARLTGKQSLMAEWEKNKGSQQQALKKTSRATVSKESSGEAPVLGTALETNKPEVAEKSKHSNLQHIESHTSKTLSAQNENSDTVQLNPVELNLQDQSAEQKAGSHSNVKESVAIGNPAPVKKAKKGNWRFAVAAGISINESSVFRNKQRDSTDQSGGSGGGGGLIPDMEKHKPGFTVAASVSREFSFSKRWKFKPGISIQYQEIKQQTGELQPYQVDPSPPDWDYSAFFYFDPGKTLEHKGNNLRVSLNSDFSFSVFKKTPSLFLNAGLYGGYNLYNHYLLPDELQVWWIPASSHFYNSLFGGVSAGIEYRMKNGTGISITGFHDLSESYEPLRDKLYYWQSVLVQLNLPLPTSR